MNNVGKLFEQQFKKSVPNYCLVHRLKDSAQSFNQSNNTKFSWDNPCDFFVFDTISCILYCLELKTTKYKSMSFESIDNDEESKKMIHQHQIKSLNEFSKYNNVCAGFIFNFRDDLNETERTYFQNITDFNSMCKNIDKKSFNEMDLILNNAKKINGIKKRVYYLYDVDSLLKQKHSEVEYE